MKVIRPSYEILNMPARASILAHLEQAARTCYKSEDKIALGSAEKLIARLVKSGHHSVLEHISVSVKIVCDRGITHELVRHRIASFSQESTRYANYSQEKFGREITVIEPYFFTHSDALYNRWYASMARAEQDYMALLDEGSTAQEARSVLPNSLKAELIVTANLREWMHIFSLRCSKAAHPQIRQIMLPLLDEFARMLPEIYSELHYKHGNSIVDFSHIAPLEGDE